MANLKLSYFDLNGGRGETARLTMHIGGIAFDDHRIPFAQWPAQHFERVKNHPKIVEYYQLRAA